VGINRRQFVSSSAIGAGLFLLEGCGSQKLSEEDYLNEKPVLWKDVVSWDHSWDAADAVTYSDDGASYGLKPAVRVDHVPDKSGDVSLRRDEGLFDSAPLPTPIPHIPGTLYQSSNKMFGGRESWYSDIVIPHNPLQPGYFYAWSSGLTSAPNPAETNWFAWEQPWWGSVLVRGVGPFDGHNSAYIDGNPGMVTIGNSESGFVRMRAWPDGTQFGPTIYSDLKYTEDTVLLQWLANNENSWLELNYKNQAGEIVSSRTQGAVSHSVMQQLHSGLSHTNYTSCIGIAKGVPTAAQTDATRNWAARYIPVAKEL
jgi:hypothetical protein